ncbi:AMP-binding protein [Tistrella bauzanensis]
MPGDGPMPDVPAHDDPAMNTMFAGFLAQARLRPSAEAVVLGAARIDYARLRTRGLAIAQAVAALPPPGAAARTVRPARLRSLKVVALILDNRLEFVEAFIGTVMAGAVVLVIDPKLTPEQGQGLLDSLRPDLLIHDPAVAPGLGATMPAPQPAVFWWSLVVPTAPIGAGATGRRRGWGPATGRRASIRRPRS